MSILDKLAKRYPVGWANEADMPQILEIFNEVWSGKDGIIKRNQKLYRRRYFENPYSRGGESIVVAKDGDRFVGFTGAMDFELSYHGKAFPATWIVDAAVLPSYQAMGIGYLLLKSFCERTVIAVAGDHSIEAQSMHQAMGVREISHCSVLRRWSHATDVLNVWKDNTYVFGKTSRIDGCFDQLWSTACECYEIVGVRNQAILKWRYENLPTREFTIYTLSRGEDLVGYIVTTFEHVKNLVRKGILVDFVFGPATSDIISKFISAVLCLLVRRGAICVDTVATHSKIVDILRNLGFYSTQHGPHFVVYSNHMTRDKHDLWDGRKWHLTLGDSDFYFTR